MARSNPPPRAADSNSAKLLSPVASDASALSTAAASSGVTGPCSDGEVDARLEGRDFVEIGEARQARFHGFVCQEDAGLLRVGRRAAGFDRDLIEHQRRDGFHTLAAAIPFESGDFAEAIGEQVEQPLGLDGAGQAHHGSSLIFPIFGFHGHEKFGAGDRAVGRLLRGSAARQLQFRALTPPRHAIGKAGQDAQQEGIFAFRRAGGRARARASQLAEQPRGVGRPLPFQQHQQVRARGVRRARRQAVPGAEQCGQRAALASHAATPRFHQQAA